MIKNYDLETQMLKDDHHQVENYSDVFILRQLTQLIPAGEILGVGLCQNYLIVSNKKNEIFRWIFNDYESIKNAYNIPIMDREKGTYTKFFCEPRGNHTIFKHNKNFYYFNIKSNKIKELSKLNKDIGLESIGWDDKSTEATTNQILIGAENGNVYCYQLDYDLKTDTVKEKIGLLITLKPGNIYGIGFGTYNIRNSEAVRYVVAVSDYHFYQFIGNSNFELLFKKYKDPKALEGACKTFPQEGSNLNVSQLQLIFKNDSLFSFGWMTLAGFCYGSFGKDPLDLLVRNFTIIPYVKLKKDGTIETEESPIATAHSDYHIFFLYSDCLNVISKITSNIVHTEYFSDNIWGMQYNNVLNEIYLYSSKSLYKLEIKNEDRDVWKAYLEKEEFEKALDHCRKKNLPFVRKVARIYANYLYERGDKNAAVKFAESDENFEEVALKFLVNGDYDSLKMYLECIEATRIKNTDKIQKTIITTWLIEIYLNMLNNVTNTDEKQVIGTNLKELMSKDCIDQSTIYQLLQQYGRIKEFLEFAQIKKDYETVILHYINEKDIKSAIQNLKQFINNSASLEKNNDLQTIFTKYSHIFMKYEPEMTIDLLMEYFKNNIDSNKIISAIMNTETKKREKVINYLRMLINESKVKDKNIHNLYIFFLSQIGTDDSVKQLLYYLQGFLDDKGQKDSVPFEVEYALKVFSQFKIYPAQAYSLAILGKYDDAIKVALDNKCILIAKRIAKSVEDQKLKKHLWLEIFNYEIKINNSNINMALEIMRESEVLKIEDVLPHLMDNIKIEVFKEEITSCISIYENDIQNLKKDIVSYNKTAENIKFDIFNVKKKSLAIRYDECICDVCNATIKDENLFIFPCGHIFDSNCVVNMLQKYNTFFPNLQNKIEKILILKNDIFSLEKRKEASKINYDMDKKSVNDRGTFFNNFSLGFNFGGEKQNQAKASNLVITCEELVKLNEMKNDFCELLSEECVLCGDLMVENIKNPFESIYDKSSWMIL